jgi:hypothetical protein
VDIRGKILDKYGRRTGKDGQKLLQIFRIFGGAYLQIIGDHAEKRPKPAKEPRKPLKSWESPFAFWRKTFRAADKDG